MSTHNAIAVPATIAFARLLRELHGLIAADKGDSPEADEIADRMEPLWNRMSQVEQVRLQGLSVDLYSLHGNGATQVETADSELQAWRESANQVVDGSQNADDCLVFLRQSIPTSVPRHFILVLQAQCWERLGDRETALLFQQTATLTRSGQEGAVLQSWIASEGFRFIEPLIPSS